MNNLQNIIEGFRDKKILVVGDLMIDRYIEGSVSRINPEAPVPIVSLRKEHYELGGAGNVVSNIIALGGDVCLFSFSGRDEKGSKLRSLLKKRRIKFYLQEKGLTTVKTRIIGENQQILRLDKEDTNEKIFSESMKIELLKEAEKASIILISDYAKGVINRDLLEFLEAYKNKMIIDPRPKNKYAYKGAFLITPNEKESLELSTCSDVDMAGNLLKKELNSNIIITRGAKGMKIFSEEILEIPTYAKEVFDVSGAGDTAIAVLALALASRATLTDAAILANHAAGIAVGKRGARAVSYSELKNKVQSGNMKIVDPAELSQITNILRREGKKIVFTNGCFDLLHIGHTRYLQEAKKLGEVLIVGLNSDDSVRQLKGSGRPILTDLERAEILSSLGFVDYIFIFPDLTIDKYLLEIKPELYVKGGDYTKFKEKELIESYGGDMRLIPLIKDKSSSGIIDRIRNGNY